MRTGVCTPHRGRVTRFERDCGSGRGRGRSTANPIEPLRGLLELLSARQRLRSRPHSVEALDPGLLGDRVAERLAPLVLAELQLHAEEPRDHLPEAALAGPSRVEAIAEPGVAGLGGGA